MSEENKKNAGERLGELEATMMNVIQAISPLQAMANDLNGLKEAFRLLNNKLDSLIKVINQNGGNVTDEALNKTMTENNAKDLTDKVSNMVSSGLLASSDTVGKNSFVVINETDGEGNVVNPRMQFLVSALQNEEVRGKLEGAKVGDNILVGDKGASVNVLESYDIVVPKAPETADASSADASAPANDSESSDGSSSDSEAPAQEVSAS